MKNIVAAILTVAVATFASAVDFPVPQGSGKLPTIALVECLAAENAQASGQFCRATYDCAGDTGVLWEGLANYNGRRVTLETDAIANQRDCVLKVADAARVQFFTGYRPEGRTGEVIAMVRSGISAASATTGTPVYVPPANMLGQFLSHASVRAATLEDWCEGRGRYFGGYDGLEACNPASITGALYIEAVPATAKSACYIEQRIVAFGTSPELWLSALHDDWIEQEYAGMGYSPDPGCNDL